MSQPSHTEKLIAGNYDWYLKKKAGLTEFTSSAREFWWLILHGSCDSLALIKSF